MTAFTQDALPPLPLIRTRGLSRSFGAVQALRDVSVDFHLGEVHGLVGANGAGKSTLLNILAGAITPSQGTLQVQGQDVRIARPKAADALGFSFIHQELALIPDFSSVDNMTLGMAGTARMIVLKDKRDRARTAADVADRLGVRFDLETPVRHLSPAERCLVAVGRALARGARFIAMDEPTASLSDVECQRLFRIVRELAADGVSVAYVSHRLGEIEQLSDRVTVFKDGQVTRQLCRGDYSQSDLVSGITGGQDVSQDRRQIAPVPTSAPVMFRAEHLADGGRVKDVSFDVREGEVIGLAGVVGAGRSEVLRLVFGDGTATAGTMSWSDREHQPGDVKEAVARGVALVPEERRSQALVMNDSIRSNITLGNWRFMRRVPALSFISDRRAEQTARRMSDKLRIKAADTQTPVVKLSGGNQQKVVFARWLARDARLLLLDEPTRGVDIGSRQQIWQTVEDFATSGRSVVVVSSELDELATCHRVVVIVEGRSVAELVGPGVTEEQMLEVIYRVSAHDQETEA